MFHGSIVALVTPMHSDGGIDYLALERLVGWHLDSGTDGLVILGTTGESATVEKSERQKIIKQVLARVNQRIPVIVGTGANSTAHTIELTRHAMEIGADATLLVTPYYNKPTQEGLFQHFKTVAGAVPIPQILYNVPSRTACDLLPETVRRLGDIGNIVGLKEATGDIERLKALLALNVNVDLFSGDDPSGLEFILTGGKGIISVTANVVPRQFHQMCEAALQGDNNRAKQLNDGLTILYKGLFTESNPIPTKWILAEMGMMEKGIRLPLTMLNEQFHDQVRNAAKAAGVEFH